MHATHALCSYSLYDTCVSAYGRTHVSYKLYEHSACVACMHACYTRTVFVQFVRYVRKCIWTYARIVQTVRTQCVCSMHACMLHTHCVRTVCTIRAYVHMHLRTYRTNCTNTVRV